MRAKTHGSKEPLSITHPKKAYIAPKLIVHGTIEELTRAVLGTPNDGNMVAPGSALG